MEARSRFGETPLLLAAQSGHADAAKALLSLGANASVPSLTSFGGNFPLHQASRGGYLGIVVALLETGHVEIDVEQEYGQTPLHYASKYCHLEIVKELKDRGADLEKRDRHGYMPGHLACNREIANILNEK